MNTQTTEVSPRPTATENRATVAQKKKTRTPHVDILETPEAFLLRADVPGVSMDAVEVTVEAGRLELSAQRPSPNYEGFRAALGADSGGEYRRNFRLPREIAHDEIRAELRDGVLVVTVPKASTERAKKIAVQAG